MKGVKGMGVKEIRWHARAGQGAKTAAQLFAEAALGVGKFIQAFPEFGPERRGAPMQAFDRVSDSPIHIHSAVENPSVVVILDETIIGTVDVLKGLPPDGVIILNTKASPEEIRERYGHRIFLAGGIDMSQLLSFGTPDEVEEECRRAIREGWPGYFIGSTTELDNAVKLENILAMYNVAMESKGSMP
jgi:2-oxoacid:acceptor oxidoreductase gamma subunit (pyruvate/2-ketoisovalerate family)